jgi:beta-N-acetylhexosaminidase
MGQVARTGMTILYPDPAVQTEPLPPAFQSDDSILIFSDSRLMRECSTCTAETAIGPDELANIIIGLYGSDATGQIDPALITSLTFAELTAFLDLQATAPLTTTPAVTATDGVDAGTVVTGTPPAASTTVTATPTVASLTLPTPTPAPPDLEAALPGGIEAPLQERTTKIATQIQDADWIIFAMLNVETTVHPTSDAVQRFLREYSDQLTDQKLVVLSLNAPYFLDATEMSRLTTYFGVYSKTQPFLEGAVRALFRAFTVAGAPPVAVPGTRFGSLLERLSPDPARTIALVVGDGGGVPIAANEAAPGAPAAEEQPALPIGTTLRITAGPIYDRNGHPVPDGTIVDFQLQFDGEVLALAVDPALTRSGMAVRDLVVERSGTLRIAATADQATTGQPVEVVILPPPTTVAPSATDAPLPAGTTEGSDTPPAAEPTAAPDRVNLLTLLIALSTIVITLSLFLIVQVRVLPRATLVHNMLWAAIFGLMGYILYGLGLFPGADWLRRNVSVWGTAAVVFVPMLLPLLWLQLRGEDR